MNCLYKAVPRLVCYARKDLRNAHIYIRDGLTGTAAIKHMSGYAAATASIDVDTVVTNTDANEGDPADQIPVGARFIVDGDDDTVYSVTSASDSMGTWTLGISPALAAMIADNAVLNILPQMTEVKVGSGNVTYSEKRNMDYETDRGHLDTVRQGEDAPVESKLEFVYEFVRASNGDPVTPVEAIKGINGAATYITSATNDTCAPFSVSILIFDNVPCGDQDDEVLLLKDFRWEGLDYDYSAASISVSGKCNVTDTESFRGTLREYEDSLLA